MSERDEKRGGAGVAIGCLLVLLFLPVLYVLGLGPAIWTSRRSPAAESDFRILYYPLEAVHNHLGPVGDLLDRYVELWQ